jgi:hypothetical protein
VLVREGREMWGTGGEEGSGLSFDKAQEGFLSKVLSGMGRGPRVGVVGGGGGG